MFLYLILGMLLGGALVWVLRPRLAGGSVAPQAGAPVDVSDTIPPKSSTRRPRVAPPSGPAPTENVVEGVAGDVKGKAFAIGRRTATIGRSSSNHIQTIDAAASRIHCQLRADAKGMWLTDMTSKVGTLVNDKPARKKTRLADGDLITIGSAIFRYRAGAVVEGDASLLPKRVDASARAETGPMGGDEKPMHTLVKAALNAANGDIQEAARALEVDVETIVAILRRDEG